MFNFFVFFLGLTALFLVIDVLQKKVFTSIRWSRKATHISSGLIIMLFPNYLEVKHITLMSILFILILFISKIRNILSLHNIKRFSWGEVYYPLSIGVLAIICLPNNERAFYAGVLCLALSDAAAAMVGDIMPIRKFYFGENQKSLGGVLGFFITTLCVLSIIFVPLDSSIVLIVLIAIALSVSELITFYGADNLVVPILAAILSIWLL